MLDTINFKTVYFCTRNHQNTKTIFPFVTYKCETEYRPNWKNIDWGCLRKGSWAEYFSLTQWSNREWIKLKEEFRNLFSIPNTVRVTKSLRMRWAKHAVSMCYIFVGNPLCNSNDNITNNGVLILCYNAVYSRGQISPPLEPQNSNTKVCFKETVLRVWIALNWFKIL